MSISEGIQQTNQRRRFCAGTGEFDNAQASSNRLGTSGDFMDAMVGHRIQSLRKRCGLSIRQLAELAHITPGVISCIERGKNSPSIATLHKILTAMGSDLASFFSSSSTQQKGHILHRELMQTISDGNRQYTIVLTNIKGIEVFDELIHPVEEKPEFEKLKSDIYGYLITGSFVLEVDDLPPETLRPGDAFFVPKDQTHRGYAVGDEPSRLISVCSNPSY